MSTLSQKPLRWLLYAYLGYWTMSTTVLFASVIHGDGSPTLLSIACFPGYLLGFAFGYGGGDGWAFIGQVLYLVPLALAFGLRWLLRRRSRAAEPD